MTRPIYRSSAYRPAGRRSLRSWFGALSARTEGRSPASNDHARVVAIAATPSHSGRETTWRVTNIPNPAAVRVSCEGQELTRWRVVGDHEIEVESTIAEQELRIWTGYRPDERSAASSAAEDSRDGSPGSPGHAGSSVGGSTVAPASPAAMAAVSGCRCC